MRIVFFLLMTPGFEPTKTRLTSESLSTRLQSHSDSVVLVSALLADSFFMSMLQVSI